MNTQGLKAGDAIYASFGRYGAVDVKAGRVGKVTPSGQITADFGERWPGNGTARPRRFNGAGWEIGAGRGDGGHLIDEEAFAHLHEKQKAAAARASVMAHLRAWSFRNKAELNALVARLNELAALVPDDESTTHRDSGSHPEGENGVAG